MAKTLCDWKKDDIARRSDKLAAIVANPSFFCAKCARCANNPKHLCKARKMPFILSNSLTP
ncbi:MAG: hypothetical protein AAGC74_07845 [Verrucomicrobiota bacterium]